MQFLGEQVLLRADSGHDLLHGPNLASTDTTELTPTRHEHGYSCNRLFCTYPQRLGGRIPSELQQQLEP